MEETDKKSTQLIDKKFKQLTGKNIDSYKFLWFIFNKEMNRAIIKEPDFNQMKFDLSKDEYDILIGIIDNLNSCRVDIEGHEKE